MRSAPSGVSGLTDPSFVAIGDFGFAALFGQDRPPRRFGLALLAGVPGLAVLFADDSSAPGASTERARQGRREGRRDA